MEFIEGIITKYIYQNKDNNYAIAKVKTKDDKEVMIVGYIPEIPNNINYRFYGDVVMHPKYGSQYKISRVERLYDTSKNGLISYLSSDLFQGIGAVTAEKIYNEFGENAINIILNDIDVLDKLNFNKLKKERFYNQLKENQNINNIYLKLHDMGLTPKMANKLYNKYGSNVIEYINENPYKLIGEIDHFSFLSADKLALKIGINHEDPFRIKSCILYVVNNICFNYGYSYLTIDQVISATFEYLNKNNNDNLINSELIKDNLTDLINEKEVIEINEKVFLKNFYETEINISNILKNFVDTEFNKLNINKIDTQLSIIEQANNIKYTGNQKDAIKEAIINDITIITGGPGTGKTTIIKAILALYVNLYDSNFLLMAPTGRAAKRMQESTGFEASTIHRSLGYDYDGKFSYNKSNKLKASLIIIDESSMIDMFLFESLFEAIPRNTKVVIVGDVDQLPSVGPGQILKDLIDSKSIKTIYLEEIHRQQEDSNILKIAFEINKQDLNINSYYGKKDLDLISSINNDISNLIIKQITNYLNIGFNLQDDIQVLIPLYKGLSGIDNINSLIQEKFNNNKKIYVNHKERNFLIGDKIIQLVNNPEKGVMNGDIGYISNIEKNEEKYYVYAIFDKLSVKYEYDELEQITLAYAISIHKSQGSEYKIVILPIVKAYAIMLQKKLIYTAVTRAKNLLCIIGNFNYLNIGIKKQSLDRQTYLKSFLINDFEENEKTPYDFL